MLNRILLLADIDSEHTEKWALGLAGKGFIVGLFSLNVAKYNWWEGNEAIENLHPISITKHGTSASSKLAYIKVLPKLKRAIKLFSPDILHAHYATSYGFLARLSGFKPFFISAWGTDVMRFPQKGWFNKRILKSNFEKADMIFATSNTIKNYITQICTKPVSVIPYGIDLSIFKSKRMANLWGDDSIVISFIKSLEKIYCIDVMIDAFAKVNQAFPEYKLRLMIVGEGAEQVNLEKKVEDLKLSASVKFTGRITYSEIAHYHNMADIFVNISEYESFGVSVIEAMACEKPVIVTDQGGLKEIVEDRDCGLLVPVRDVGETAKAIEQLLVDPAYRSKLGKRGREVVTQYYNWENNLQQQIDIYHSYKK